MSLIHENHKNIENRNWAVQIKELSRYIWMDVHEIVTEVEVHTSIYKTPNQEATNRQTTAWPKLAPLTQKISSPHNRTITYSNVTVHSSLKRSRERIAHCWNFASRNKILLEIWIREIYFAGILIRNTALLDSYETQGTTGNMQSPKTGLNGVKVCCTFEMKWSYHTVPVRVSKMDKVHAKAF